MYKFRGKIFYELDDVTRQLNTACELVFRMRDLLLSKTDWQEFLERESDDSDLPIIVDRPTDDELLKTTEDLQMAADSLALLEMALYEHHLIPNPKGRFKGGFRIDPSAIRARPSPRGRTRHAASGH